MGKIFNKFARKRFDIRMSQLEEFAKVTLSKDSEFLVSPGERIYRRDRQAVSDWISLLTSPKGLNEFSGECGYSRHSRFPRVTMRPSIFDLDPASLDVDEGFFVLREEGRENYRDWSLSNESLDFDDDIERLVNDVTEDEAAGVVIPLVDSAFDVLLRKGIPILDSIK